MLSFVLSLILFILPLTTTSMAQKFDAEEEEGAPISESFKALIEVCGNPDVPPQNCTCDKGKIFPDDIEDIGLCKPIKCTCPEDPVEKVITFFGCANGGFPDCPIIGDETSDMEAPWDNYLCGDGTELKLDHVINSRIRGECVCNNGAKPVCRATNQLATCPDGTEPEADVGYLPAFFQGCV